MKLIFRAESVTDVDRAADIIVKMTEFIFMMMEHAVYDKVDPKDVDVSMMLECWTKGMVHVFTANEDKEIVGMSIWIDTPSIWRPKKQSLSSLMVFVQEDYRKSGIGAAFLEFVKKELSKKYPKGTLMVTDLVAGNPYKEAFVAMGFSPFLERVQGVL